MGHYTVSVPGRQLSAPGEIAGLPRARQIPPPLMPSRYFPPANRAGPDGLVLIGGRLSTPRLLDAYRHGIFPWPAQSFDLIPWCSPDPRAILPLDGMHISRRLERTRRSGKFAITYDTAFAEVIEGCASGDDRRGGTWLTVEMIAAYTELHRLGHAHSVETWHDGALAGGVYGVAIGGLFAAESMFYRVRDASKVALAGLVERLQDRGFQLLDVQQPTPHSRSMGAIEIPRQDYLRQLRDIVDLAVTFG